MPQSDHRRVGDDALQQVLGYLNFSSGRSDPQFLVALDAIDAQLPTDETPRWQRILTYLDVELTRLATDVPAFKESSQATAVLQLLTKEIIPGYLDFHRDLLFHQDENNLFCPFFLGRVCEVVLQESGPWEETDRICQGTIRRLNNYLGYRPVAALETRKIEPYDHEWTRPIPIYVRDAGVSRGPHQRVVTLALQLLAETDEDLLRAAHFDPELLDELAIDARAYDFDHPVNKRPNYHFGLWDPHCIDNRGYYRRFVLQQITLDTLMNRPLQERDRDVNAVSIESDSISTNSLQKGGLPQNELEYEAAAVLAGTILMASGTSGSGPGAYDSSVTLSTLLPRIAHYRDQFYEQLVERTASPHRERLEKEMARLQQPFGGARQHLNSELARHRATQLEHVRLAKLFARIGHVEAAARQTSVVPVASARLSCRIDCLLSDGQQSLRTANLERALKVPSEMRELIDRGIQCGALVDPWNILGFDCQFSLFPAPENSVYDHRVDEFLELTERMLAFHSQLWGEVSALDRQDLCPQIDKQFHELALWLRQFAAHEVSHVEYADPQDVYESARHVAEALRCWHEGGAAAGDLGFWSQHAEMFTAPKAYALVIEALLDRRDFVSLMSLLIHWLSQADEVRLEHGDSSFHRLALQWVLTLSQSGPDDTSPTASDLLQKFIDYLEANAGTYWEVPEFTLTGTGKPPDAQLDDLFNSGDEDPDEADDDLYGAAYEDVVFRDSTDDGFEGTIFHDGNANQEEWIRESSRISDRLAFLQCLAQIWQLVAVHPTLRTTSSGDSDSVSRLLFLAEQASRNHRDLLTLLQQVADQKLQAPAGDHESLVDYDRKRFAKDNLLERVIATAVLTSSAQRLLFAAAHSCQGMHEVPDDEVTTILACLLDNDLTAFHQYWPRLIASLRDSELLYVPLSKGGNASKIVDARVRQTTIRDLLSWLPRRGLLSETRELLELARAMERNNPVGHGAVTEFDDIFAIGYRAVVTSLVESARHWGNQREDEQQLVTCLERLTESLLYSWLEHSRTLRLSVLEKVETSLEWEPMVRFIQDYGDDLFTQKFLNLPNLRAILHAGVDSWVGQCRDDDARYKFLEDLGDNLPEKHASQALTLILEAVIENYTEYREYNSTTTQSDRGDRLYTLLDFLRLRVKYDRICWNLRPIVLAHDVLVRNGYHDAAATWRHALKERIGGEADQFLTEMEELQEKYAMRIPMIADRLAERFVKPLAIDRLRAMVEPAIEEMRRGGAAPVFELLESECANWSHEPTGAGLDIPPWINALEEEVERINEAHEILANDDWNLGRFLPFTPLSVTEIHNQLDQWSRD